MEGRRLILCETGNYECCQFFIVLFGPPSSRRGVPAHAG